MSFLSICSLIADWVRQVFRYLACLDTTSPHLHPFFQHRRFPRLCKEKKSLIDLLVPSTLPLRFRPMISRGKIPEVLCFISALTHKKCALFPLLAFLAPPDIFVPISTQRKLCEILMFRQQQKKSVPVVRIISDKDFFFSG